MAREAILKVTNLRTYFFSRYKPPLRAVDGVSYEVKQGETVAVAGESGYFKREGSDWRSGLESSELRL